MYWRMCPGIVSTLSFAHRASSSATDGPHPRSGSTSRGVLAAIVFHYVALFGLLFLFWLLRAFVWSAIYGTPYQPTKGPLDPSSGEWLSAQAIGFLSTVASGLAACHWDKVSSNRAILIVGFIYLGLMAIGDVPATADPVRTAIFYFQIPLALISAWLLSRRFEPGYAASPSHHGRA